ncbi:3'-5'-exoribonuclease family protein, partial [Thalictrum thalictroides]
HIPAVSVNDEGRVVSVSEEQVEGNSIKEPLNKGKRKLTLSSAPFALTCILHKKYILADPTAEEESIMETLVTVVLDATGRLVSFYKPGGAFLAYTSAVQDCIALTRQRVKELQKILIEAVADMELD